LRAVQLREYAEKGKLNEIPAYDMMLEDDDTMAIIGDLHIGTPQSLWLPCLRRLKKIRPTHLVLLGDTFDFMKSRPRASHAVGFLRLLKSLSVHARSVSRCSDSSVPGFLETLARFAFVKGPEEPQLYNPVLTEAIRGLVVFWRFSKRKIRIKLTNGKMVVLSHGHELGFQRNTDPEKVMARTISTRSSMQVI